MKIIILLFAICFATALYSQEHKLEQLWQTDSVIAIPESVLADTKGGILYVSLINGGPWVADGKGGIGRLSIDGKKYDSTWITGLNAPKGMALLGNRLYVADMNEVVIIDVSNGKIEKKIAIESAQALNDITISEKGAVYVSDSRAFRIWMLENDKPVLYLDSMSGVNGLKAVGDELIIASGKSFLKADSQKKITKIADLPQGGDGIEPVGNGDYIVTSWGGYIYYVYADGRVETLLDTHLEKKNSADIGYDPVNRIVYVPTFFAKTVVAYRLN
ncbi:MAG TPA: ATP-binding protein [Chitinophagaceae bacterium]